MHPGQEVGILRARHEGQYNGKEGQMQLTGLGGRDTAPGQIGGIILTSQQGGIL